MQQRTVQLPGLRRERARKGLSQAELGRAADVQRDNISRIETGLQGAFPTTAQRLADALGVKVRDLMRGDDEDENGRAA